MSDFPQRVTLTAVHHGSAGQNRSDRIYGTLVDADTGAPCMVATLDVLLDAVRVRRLVLVCVGPVVAPSHRDKSAPALRPTRVVLTQLYHDAPTKPWCNCTRASLLDADTGAIIVDGGSIEYTLGLVQARNLILVQALEAA